ncbi:MAG: acyl-CoA thioesterase [Sandaracinaceae bacterium]|nr:acyl-CoA thioesterase [Sandaracinaceae bacterium]
MDGKTARDSYTEMTELVLPQHGNVLGTAFGGTVLAWIDVCGAIAAQRHCLRVAVTAAIDEVNFLSPIRVGDVVVLSARVNAAFNTSLEVEVQVKVEDRGTLRRRSCVDAFMTFVPIGDDARPCKVPALIAESSEDERRAREALARRQARLARRST